LAGSQNRPSGAIKFFSIIKLAIFLGVGYGLALVLAMMTSATLEQQSTPTIFRDARRAGMMNRFMRFRYDLQLKFSVRPAVLILAVLACLAAWGIAAIFMMIV